MPGVRDAGVATTPGPDGGPAENFSRQDASGPGAWKPWGGPANHQGAVSGALHSREGAFRRRPGSVEGERENEGPGLAAEFPVDYRRELSRPRRNEAIRGDARSRTGDDRHSARGLRAGRAEITGAPRGGPVVLSLPLGEPAGQRH